MWTEICRRKHSYLQKMCHDVKPCILNRSMCRALLKPLTDPTDMEPPFLIPCSLQPCMFAPNVDPTRAKLAYGDWGMPLLIRQIHDEDTYIRRCALATLTEELRNPEKCFTAMKLNIIKRFDDVLNNLKDQLDEFRYEVEKICISLAIIATYLEGGLKLLIEPRIIENLYSLITGIDCTSHQAALVLINMSSHLKIAEDMVQADHLDSIKNVLEVTDELCDVYEELSHLVERYPEKAFCKGYFDILLNKIVEETTDCNTTEKILKCFALLINCRKGQQLSDKRDVIPIFIDILKVEQPSVGIYEFAALTIKNLTLTRSSRWRCREFWDLPYLLIKHAHCKDNQRLQLYCLQILRQITEMPSVKEFVSKCCKANIKNINTRNNPELKKNKFKLLVWLRHRNYRPDIEVNNYDNQEYNENPLTDTRRVTYLKEGNDSHTEIVCMRDKSPNLAYRIDKLPLCFKHYSPATSLHSYNDCTND